MLTAETYAGQAEVDVEDLLLASLYLDIVNGCYGLKGKRALPAPSHPTRIVKHHFRTLAADALEIDHHAPAAHFVVHRSAVLRTATDIDDVLARFERLFTDLNALL